MTEHFKHNTIGTIGILVTYTKDKNTPLVEIINTQGKAHNQTELDYMYELLECRTVDCVRLKDCDVWIDDEGIMVQDNPVMELLIENAPSPHNKLILAGNLLFSKGVDDEGETTWFSLEDKEDRKKIEHIKYMITISRTTII
ncbi:MAG: DUF3846 domain-containing protein [Sulfurovum sp.]|nr:DUF3846 domain-containing protein [Sulfurovum sp.]